ncbi:MAG: amidohydrolase, partial [Candidatus Limnocylindrales bacterium]
AIAVGEGRIVAAGTLAEVEAVAGRGTRRLALDGGSVVLPALTDAHLHLTDAALMARQVDLNGLAAGPALARLADVHRRRVAAGDETSWLVGLGWSTDAFGHWPRAAELDRIAPGRPIALWSHDLHSRWVSSAALAAAGLLASGVGDPPGGVIERDADGTPSGLLLEHAAGLVDGSIPAPTDEQIGPALEAYAGRLASLGIVACHDPGELAPDPAALRGPALYGRLAAGGRLPLRVHGSVRVDQLELAIEHGLRTGAGVAPDRVGDSPASRSADRARVGWLKIFADGSLGSRSAALFAPYAGGDGRGRLLVDRHELLRLVGRAAAAGIVPQIHAIGDRAVRLALDVLEATPAARTGPAWSRVEHVQLALDVDADRFARLRVAASVQPAHLLHDAPVARAAWPRRLAHAYRWRSLADGGAPLAFGTDAPVESPDPWPGIAVAVTRRRASERRPFPGQETLDLARALRAAIVDPVLIAGEAAVGGRLLPGHRADLIVVPAEALEAPVGPEGPLATCRPRLTLLDGEEVARSADFAG